MRLFNSESEALILKTLGEKSSPAVLQRDFGGAIPETEQELSIYRRFAKGVRGSVRAVRTDPLTPSELEKRYNFIINIKLP